MKIFFSPSEAKSDILGNLIIKKFSFDSQKREIVLEKYDKFINKNENLDKFFGLKDDDLITHYKTSFKQNIGIKAVLRYTGVAYKALDYANLNDKAQTYIDKNTIIFSNLFGPLLAQDIIPDYKFKQGAKIGDFNVENFYKQNFSDLIDEFIKYDDILDLRAGFYEKFYTIKKPFTTLKFIKNNKIVSHYAKHYRGIVLKELAKNYIENLSDFLNLEFEKLRVKEMMEIKNKKEIILEICD